MNKKIKCLILACALFITIAPLNVFSETVNSDQSKSGQVELDGKIGEWDPGNEDQPNFDEEGLEIEGEKPSEGEYFTISVTVPVNMEFTVFPHTNMAFGYFYSPEYTVKNNGSKEIDVK
ncbi:MAG: hypothetical protein O7C59_00070, partial [Rickettsia endosymbiont of Ixodes persulcatus]|nr:hypothetical protein [Rickettsia endosymbiont of Ixodes persulcatus]